jgi:hypothetical protein
MRSGRSASPALALLLLWLLAALGCENNGVPENHASRSGALERDSDGFRLARRGEESLAQVGAGVESTELRGPLGAGWRTHRAQRCVRPAGEHSS